MEDERSGDRYRCPHNIVITPPDVFCTQNPTDNPTTLFFSHNLRTLAATKYNLSTL